MNKRILILIILFLYLDTIKSNNTIDSLNYYREIVNENDNKENYLNNILKLANIYNKLNFIDSACKYYTKTIDLSRQNGDTSVLLKSLNGISSIYIADGKYREALKKLNDAQSLAMALGDSLELLRIYNNIGNAYINVSLDSALISFNSALLLAKKLGYSNEKTSIYLNISSIYLRIDSCNKTIELLNKLNQVENKFSERQKFNYYSLMINSLICIDSLIKAEYYLNSIDTNNYDNKALLNYYQLGFVLYKKSKKYEKACSEIKKYIDLLNSLKNKNSNLELYEFKNEKVKEARIKAKNNKYRISVVIIIFLGLAIFQIYHSYQKKKLSALYKELESKNEETLKQNDKIKEQLEFINKQHKDITDSINYAQKIQSSMLPPEAYITELLHENFIFNYPRDIVSGDFYWIKQVKQYIVLVAADCTGHGIPGAFLSLLGISYLNEIVERREITQANLILNELRSQIKDSLRQHGQKDESKDGMDMALCVIDIKNKMMQYSGAYNPLYLIRDENGKSNLIEYKADRMPIGFFDGRIDQPFTNHEIKLEMGDTLYIFSDGFIDQFGGENNKKFMSKNFKKLLLEIHKQPLLEQKENLEKTLKNWMNGNAQLDDILVIGMRVR